MEQKYTSSYLATKREADTRQFQQKSIFQHMKCRIYAYTCRIFKTYDKQGDR